MRRSDPPGWLLAEHPAVDTPARCVARRGAAAGLAILEALRPPDWLRDYDLWGAALGELYRRDGQSTRAAPHLRRALERAPTHAEQALLRKRLTTCQPD